MTGTVSIQETKNIFAMDDIERKFENSYFASDKKSIDIQVDVF